MADLYKVLGVEKSASATEISRAYKRLALIHHPDKGGDEEAFKQIGTAYGTLSDDDKRRHYDMTGQIRPEGGQGGPSGGPFGFPFDISNLFGMFGGGKGRGKGAKAPPKRETLRLTLAQLYVGHTFTIQLDRTRVCPPCAGSGAARKEPCSSCGGRGISVQTLNMGGMIMQTQGPCASCAGDGYKTVEVCGTCRGTKRISEKKSLDVKIPAGTQEGEVFTFSEACSEVPDFEKAGDLQLILEQELGSGKRIGSGGQHLETEVVLNLSESVLGCRVALQGHPSCEDEPLYVQLPPGSFTGDVFCVTGQGMPVKGTVSEYGDMYLRIRVVVKVAERTALATEAVQGPLKGVLGSGKRAEEPLPEGGDVLTELYLTKLP